MPQDKLEYVYPLGGGGHKNPTLVVIRGNWQGIGRGCLGSVQSKQVTSLPFHVWRKPKRLEQYPQVDPGYASLHTALDAARLQTVFRGWRCRVAFAVRRTPSAAEGETTHLPNTCCPTPWTHPKGTFCRRFQRTPGQMCMSSDHG